MNAMNATIPPNSMNPTTATSMNPGHYSRPMHGATTDTHNEVHHSKLRTTLHDIKETVKETLQRDHHHGQDCVKKPQDGKTNPME